MPLINQRKLKGPAFLLNSGDSLAVIGWAEEHQDK